MRFTAPPRRRFLLGAASLALWTGSRSAAVSQTNALTLDLTFGPRVPADMQVKLKDWASRLDGNVALWWPRILADLSSPGFAPADRLTLAFYRISNPNVPALTTRGPAIVVDPWKLVMRLNNPDTFGMVAHELVHVAQAYPEGARPGWITEGIADYMRYYVLLPNDEGRFFDPKGLDERTGYQPTAGLLDWIESEMPGSVRRINQTMREGGDGAETLAHIGGASPHALWRAYMASRPRAADPEAAERRLRAIQS